MVDLVGQTVSLRATGPIYKGLCPFHTDKNTPSLVVYPPSHAHCFGCGKHWDSIAWVQERDQCNFLSAVEWLANHSGQFTAISNLKIVTQKKNLIPIEKSILDFWYNQTTDEIRDYYHKRLLTDDTIDRYQLGWNGQRYVIPIWEGTPGQSIVYSVRLRASLSDMYPKYLGLRHRSQSRLFNQYLLDTAETVVIFIGEFDAILGQQDGLIALSPTAGQGSWRPEWTKLFINVKHIYVVPDYGELVKGHAIASNFVGRSSVHTFPKVVKDYTEYRLAGNTVEDFKKDILRKRHIPVEFEITPHWEGK